MNLPFMKLGVHIYSENMNPIIIFKGQVKIACGNKFFQTILSVRSYPSLKYILISHANIFKISFLIFFRKLFFKYTSYCFKSLFV